MLHEYGELHRTLADIGKECGVSRQAVKQAADKFGIKHVRVSERIDVAWLREQREAKKRSQQDIADELGISQHIVSRLCVKHKIEIPRRTQEERKDKRRAWSRAYQNRRFATDPVYREAKKACTSRWQKAHPAECRAIQATYRAKKKREERT